MVITTHMMHKISNIENKDNSKKTSSEIQVLKEYLKNYDKSEENQEITS